MKPRSGRSSPAIRLSVETLARARLSEQGGDALPVGEGDGQLEGSEIEADVNLDHSKLATRFSAQRWMTSDATSATSAMTMAMIVRRIAPTSPPGTWVSV